MMKLDEEIINELDKTRMFTKKARKLILGLMGLARMEERKRIREEIKHKQFEVELPNEDGFVKVVLPGDIDIWK